MKKSKLNTVMCVLFIGLSSISCDNYLDFKSDASLLVPKSLEDLQAIMDDSGVMNLRIATSLGTSVDDDYYLTQNAFNALSEDRQGLYLWKPTFEFIGVGNDWARSYQAVYNSNLVLELLLSIERSDLNRGSYDNVHGSALFFRSFYFLGLLVQHGHAYDAHTSDRDLGIALRQTSDFNVPSVRATVADCYAKIIADLNAAIELLPDYPQHVMRPSKGAAHALLARTYLYMRDYSKAKIHSEAALALNNRLMIFGGDDDVLSLAANVPFRKYSKETIFYAEAASSTIYTTNRGSVDTSLYRSYHDDDLRKKAFFRLSNGDMFFKGNHTGSSTVLFGGISTSEMYLTLAECQAFLGEIDHAMGTLNYFLKSRWANTVDYPLVTASNSTEALEIIRLERRKELCFRNLRWADIKRYNKEGANLILRRQINGELYEIQPNDPFYALPLPKAIVDLTDMPQN